MTRLAARRGLLTVLLASFAFIAFSIVSSKSVSAGYDGARLIDDIVFLDSKSMDASQIQSFLSSKGSGLASRSFLFNCYGADSKERQWYTAVGAPCDQVVPASQIIYYAAQIYGINPRVVLATLQKEQSLITSPNPTDWQINQAMGYGCPTTGGCGVSNFFYQIDSGIWVLRYHFERARGNMTWWSTSTSWTCGTEKNFYKPNLYPGQNVRFYDEDGVLYRTYYIVSAATSSLYCYTPHAYNNPNGLYGLPPFGTTGRYYTGSYNFVKFFELWFGSTSYKTPLGGLLYYQVSTGKIYLVTTDNSTRYYVPTWALLQNYKLDGYQIVAVDDSVLNQYADGGTLSSLVWDNTGVYLVNDGIKYHVPGGLCGEWAFACADGNVTKQLGGTFQNSHLKSGTQLYNLANHNGVFYKMQGGQRMPIANAVSLAALGYTANQALWLTDANVIQPLGALLITNPTSIRFGNGIYYFNGIDYHWIPDNSYLAAWGITSIFTPPASSYDTSGPPLAADLSKWYIGGNGNRYLIDGGRRILLDNLQQQLWPGANYQSFSSPMAETLPIVAMEQFVWSNPKLYMVSGGQKHYIPTYSDYIALGVNSNQVISIDPAIMELSATGNDALGDGKLVSISGNPKIYVVNNHKLLHIPDASVFGAFGFNWGAIYTYPNSLLSDYPEDEGVLRAVKHMDGSFSYMLNGYRLVLNPFMAAYYGLKTSQFKEVTNHVSKNMKPGIILSPFLYNVDDGKIYYASGGAMHYVSSYEAFVAYGGLRMPTHLVDEVFLNNFIIGQSI